MISHFADPDLAGNLLTFEHRRASGEAVRILLAEGDSWFSIGGATSNLLMALDDDNTLIVNCASPGDTLRNIRRLGNEPLWMMLSPRFGTKWDAVLLSAGGNDLLGDVRALMSGGNLNNVLLRLALDEIERGYLGIIAGIRRHHAGPIHAHTYDYPVSDPHGGWLRAGPWIGRHLLEAGYNAAQQGHVITFLIDALAERLRGLPDLTLHDTRGTLTPGRWRWAGWQKHWRNEIHPSAAGYGLLAAKWKL